jgi:hypothetical protein
MVKFGTSVIASPNFTVSYHPWPVDIVIVCPAQLMFTVMEFFCHYSFDVWLYMGLIIIMVTMYYYVGGCLYAGCLRMLVDCLAV